MNRAEWLEERRKSIGGSDAATIIGYNEWSSPYELWADKTGRIPPKTENEAMRIGHDLEDYVAKRFTESTGKKCRRNNKMIRNSKYPFAHGNIDRWIMGENAGLECKTTNAFNATVFKNGTEYPANYYIQCMHYIAVTGAERWYLAVLVLGREFFVYTIERNEDEITALMEAEEAFWRYVTEDTPPPVDGSEATTDTINTIYKECNSQQIELFGRDSLISRYFEIDDLMDNMKKQQEEIKQQLMLDMGESEIGISGNAKVTWKKATRNTFDSKRFLTDNEDILKDIDISEYYKTTEYRTFKIANAIRDGGIGGVIKEIMKK